MADTPREVDVNARFAVSSYAKVQRETSVESASPHRLIEMLYDGAVDRVVQAKGAIEHKNVELRGEKINSAISIVAGLRMSLNTDEGGEIAENLDGLYVYIQSVLAKAHREASSELLDEALDLLSNMRDTWKQIG